MTSRLVLASSSPYRRALLQRLGLPFTCDDPGIDEAPHPDEDPRAMVTRLAEAKARSTAGRYPHALVIGSDQCAVIDDVPAGKPGNRNANIEQLHAMSGRWIDFLTAVCVIDTDSGRCQTDTVTYSVRLRQLSDEQIAAYVDLEQPFDCAGGFKSEGLGVALFEQMRGDDPTALIGLPLIALRRMLEAEGIDVLRPESRIPASE